MIQESDGVWHQLAKIQSQTEDYQKKVDLQHQKMNSENKYYNSIFQKINDKVSESLNIL